MNRNLTYSIFDGVFYSVMVGFGEIYLAPYAIHLGASDFLVGLLGTLPLFAGALAQLATPSLLAIFGNRKSLVLTGVLLQALCYLPILGAGRISKTPALFLILWVTLYWVFHLSVNPAWQSWMGDLVPAPIRGRYFSDRSRWMQLASLSSIVVAGIFLGKGKYVFLFVVALLARLVSWSFLQRQEEPPHRSPAVLQFTFWQFVKKMRFNNYGIFVIYSSLLSFSVHLGGPFFSPYLLRTLHFTAIDFMCTQAIFIASKSLFLPVWGHYSDRYGARKLLSLCGYLVPYLPLGWLLIRDPLSSILVQLIAGFFWAGYELCSFNFILDCTTPERRTRCAAYYQVLVGFGTVLGALVGALLLRSPHFFKISYWWVFLASAVARWIVSLIFLPKIREMRVVEPISYRTLLLRMFLLLKPSAS